ncbi:hypothetical protein ACT29H_04950 [Thermophagus sp. OGC60D27]|uniref:hypothetical protein n=1 Tax=Thermophagus sp. OGC60D27 TaxID=3458415 RepID=UPI004037CA06
MKNITLKLLLTGFIIMALIVIPACDDGYTINTKKMLAEEKALMEDYYFDVVDTLKEVSYNIVDTADDKTFVYFELRQGSGDSVKVGKVVGFRYVYYEIASDTTNTPFIYPYASNYHSDDPYIYTVGNTNTYQGGIYPGIDLALRNMAYGTKARVFIGSSLWTNDFVPRVVDLEVTYIEK